MHILLTLADWGEGFLRIIGDAALIAAGFFLFKVSKVEERLAGLKFAAFGLMGLGGLRFVGTAARVFGDLVGMPERVLYSIPVLFELYSVFRMGFSGLVDLAAAGAIAFGAYKVVQAIVPKAPAAISPQAAQAAAQAPQAPAPQHHPGPPAGP